MGGKVRRRIEKDREGQQRYSNEMNKEKGAEREDDEKLRWDSLKENVEAKRGGGAEGHAGGRRQVGSSGESEKSKREGRMSQKKERKKRRGKR